MLGTLGRCRDERQVDLTLRGAGQLDLGLFGRLGQTLQSLLVLTQVNAFVRLEGLSQVIDDHFVEVIATQVRITGGGEHLKDPVTHLEHGHVEGAAAQIENKDALVALLVEAIGQSRRGGLVDDPQHLEAGDLAGILGGLTLGIVEISGNGDHRLGDGLTEIFTGVLGQLAQNLGRDLFRGELLVENRALHLHVGAGLLDAIAHFLGFLVHLIDTTADEALDGIKGVVRIHHRLTLGDLTDQLVLVLGVSHDGGRGPETLGVRDHGGFATFHHGHATVRGAKVNADNLAHRWPPPEGMNETSSSSSGDPAPGEVWFPNRQAGRAFRRGHDQRQHWFGGAARQPGAALPLSCDAERGTAGAGTELALPGTAL